METLEDEPSLRLNGRIRGSDGWCGSVGHASPAAPAVLGSQGESAKMTWDIKKGTFV